MSSLIIGVDPDCEKHGIAIYKNGELSGLRMLSLIDCVNIMKTRPNSKWIIEKVTANNFVYARNQQKTKALQAQVGRAIGKNQQAMIELVRFLDEYQIEYELIPPTRDNWAKDKRRFEAITGWKGRSNQDTRSAAYFGFRGL